MDDANGFRMQDRNATLCVDMDGTLLRTDVLLESALALLRINPLYVFRLFVWLTRGKANLKRQIALRSRLDVASLPYDARVVDWLRSEQSDRRLVLCSAADHQLVEAVASHVGGFDEVFGSDGRHNLSGATKAQLLASRYGDGEFDYAGNSADDLPVWRRARAGIVVNASAQVLRRARDVCRVDRVFARESAAWRVWSKALRLYQWLKNVLVFLPLLTAHLVLIPTALLQSAAAFICFGLCASAMYILNDLLDLEADRQHPRKRDRPFAAGSLPIGAGLLAAPILLSAAFALAIGLLSPLFALVLLGYCLLTTAYSLTIKGIPALDVITLAGLYATRILAGAAALQIPVSFWLLAFSMFLFMSLAMIKRYTELLVVKADGRTRASGRGYTTDDLPLVQSLGTASAYLSVLVLALYVNSTASEALYRHPQMLWLLCPMLLYWLSHIWLVTHRGGMYDDPVLFALTDPASRVVLVVSIALVLAAV